MCYSDETILCAQCVCEDTFTFLHCFPLLFLKMMGDITIHRTAATFTFLCFKQPPCSFVMQQRLHKGRTEPETHLGK
ncbi:hypothetical protein FKM82_023602 [Ascaphus truei]